MKLTRRFAQLTPEKRPQDPNMDGTGLRFMEHGGEYPDAKPQAIRVVDARPLLHIRPDHAGRQSGRQSRIHALDQEED